MSLSRKRKKQLRRLQKDANQLWEAQQELVGHAAGVAREASHQLGHSYREQVVPVVQDAYNRRVAPVVDRGVKIPPGLVVGEDPEEDERRFRRTDKGICLITQSMIDRLG